MKGTFRIPRGAAVLGAIAIGLAVLMLISAAAFAQLAAPDLPPFTATEEVWRANLTSFGPGTIVYLVEYRSRDDWTVTEVSHSFDPRYNGTSWSFKAPTSTFFDAMRRVLRTEAAPEGRAPDKWLRPALMQNLQKQPGWLVSVGHLHRSDRIPTGASERTDTTDIDFDPLTGLPRMIESRVDGQLVERVTYTYR